MKTLATALLTLSAALFVMGPSQAEEMKKDDASMEKKAMHDDMKDGGPHKDGMHKDGMKSDSMHDGIKKEGMMDDGKPHGDMKDGMKKNDMKKDTMSDEMKDSK